MGPEDRVSRAKDTLARVTDARNLAGEENKQVVEELVEVTKRASATARRLRDA